MTTLRKDTRKRARRANNKIAPVASDARESAVKYAGATRDWAAPKAETAKDWAAPKAEAAKDWAAPRVEPAVTKVKEDVVPKVAAAVTAALAASEPVREEAASRGSAAIAALKGEVAPPKPRRRKRKLVLLIGVLGAAYAGWKAWASSKADQPEPWTTPTLTSTGNVGVTDAPVTDDVAGASPDEALADAAEENALTDPTVASSAPVETETVTPKQAQKVRDEAEAGRSTT